MENDNLTSAGLTDNGPQMPEEKYVRLQKYLSECGLMSRRAAETEISAGNVTVNGETAELGRKVLPGKDVVKFRGRDVSEKILNSEKIYLLLNKPAGYVTTMKDEKNRRCVAELVSSVKERVYPVGRLDFDSEGLLIMTNDGELANQLMHPRHNIPKIYNVTIKGTVTSDQLRVLSSPLVLDGYRIVPVKIDVVTEQQTFTVLRFYLYEGRNRQIRKMCAIAGVEIIRLVRVAIGNIKLGELKPGKFREMTPEELLYLRP